MTTVSAFFAWTMIVLAFVVGYIAADPARVAALKRFRLVRRIGRDQVIPRGYGIAWSLYLGNAYVCMPVPLNLFAGVARYVWNALCYAAPLVADPREAYRQGKRDSVDRDPEVADLRFDLVRAVRLLREVADEETVEPEPDSLVGRIDTFLFDSTIGKGRRRAWMERGA